jgi:stage II sporulation protein R
MREASRMKRRTYLILFILALGAWGLSAMLNQDVIFSADENRPAAVANEIPAQAIRLRILANSDSAQDQWLKRKVRDEIVHEMETWVKKPQTIEEARQAIRERLPHFREIALDTVRKYGAAYPVRVEFGQVQFPTKMYGNKVYPAGRYEALLITLGKGEGENWWCVLFPPLCFIDMSNGDAVRKQEKQELSGALSATLVPPEQAFAAGDENRERARKQEQAQDGHGNRKGNRLEVRFWLLDKVSAWFR